MVRLNLSLAFFVPGLSLGFGLSHFDNGERAMVVGALLGVLMGCIFGGAIKPDSKIANFLFGPQEKD